MLRLHGLRYDVGVREQLPTLRIATFGWLDCAEQELSRHALVFILHITKAVLDIALKEGCIE